MQKIFYFLLFTLLFSCKNNKTKHPYTPTGKVKLDSLTAWLRHSDNTTEKTYATTFQTHIEKQSAANNIDSVFKIIQYSTEAISNSYGYDTVVIDNVKAVLYKEESKLTPAYRAAIYNNLTKIFLNVEAHDSCIYYARKGIVPIQDYVTALNVGEIYNALLQAFSSMSQYDSAIVYGQKAEAIFMEQNIPLGLGACYDNMSGLYGNIKDYEKQSYYLNKAIAIAKEANIENGILVSYINRMGYKLERDDNQSALADADTVLNYYKQFKVTEPMFSIIVYSAKSLLMNINGNTIESKKYLDTAQNYLMLHPEYEQLDFYRLALLEQCKSENSIGRNKMLFDNMLINSQEQKDYKSIINIASLYYQEAVKNNNLQEALKYHILWKDAKDSVTKENQQKIIFDLDKKYQTAKKEKTIVEQKEKINTSKFQITALLFSLIGLGLGSLTYFGYKKRKEAQAETIRQQKFTDDLLQNTEDERKRIATDLHDGVNHELLTLKNAADKGKPIASSDIEKVIHEVRQVSRDLYPAMFDNIGLAASIETLCERMTEAGLFTTCDIDYALKLSKRNELQLYRIIQEALNNTLKHAKANAAKVTINTVDNELQVEIKDNGIGFNTEEKMNNASSFGIQSLIQRARSMGGKSTIESNEQGTKLLLKTPIH